MQHTGTIRLETDRLLLRPFTPEDAQQMYDNWASDPEATRFLTWKPHASVDATRNWLTYRATQYEKPDYYGWAITLKDSGEVIGDISIVRSDEDLRMAELGWVLARKCWGQGYAPEAARAMIDHLIDTVGYHRIQAWHDVQNPKSGRAMIKSGMRYEGTLRQYARNSDGGFIDVAIYSIIESDARRKDPLRP